MCYDISDETLWCRKSFRTSSHCGKSFRSLSRPFAAFRGAENPFAPFRALSRPFAPFLRNLHSSQEAFLSLSLRLSFPFPQCRAAHGWAPIRMRRTFNINIKPVVWAFPALSAVGNPFAPLRCPLCRFMLLSLGVRLLCCPYVFVYYAVLVWPFIIVLKCPDFSAVQRHLTGE